MLVFITVFFILFTPSENELFKTLFLIKYTEEYNLYKNDINFEETELKNLLKKEVKTRLIIFKEAQKKIKFNKTKYFQKIFDLKQQYNTDNLETISVKTKIPKKIILKNLEIDTYTEDFLSKVLFKDITVTKDEISQYYYSNLNEFTIEKKILLYHIFSISKPKIINIQKKLDYKKNNFKTLAHKYSEAPERYNNGSLGWVAKKDLPTYFSYAFKMKKNKFSKIIQSKAGYHIFYVKDIKTNQYIPLKSVENDIKVKLLMAKQEEILNNFIKNHE